MAEAWFSSKKGKHSKGKGTYTSGKGKCSSPPEESCSSPPKESCSSPQKESCSSPPKGSYSSPPKGSCSSPPKESCSSPPKESCPSPSKERCSFPPKKRYSSPLKKRYSSPPKKRYPSPPKKRYSSPTKKKYPSHPKKRFSSPVKEWCPPKAKESSSSPVKEKYPFPEKRRSSSPEKGRYSSPEKRRYSPEKHERRPDHTRTYEGMVTRFIMSLTHRRPNKLKEIQTVMTPESSTFDMFSFIWGLREAHLKMSPPIFKSKKSDKSSFIYWRLGNTHLNRKDKDLALKYFNLSIQLAPHPQIVVDDKVMASDVTDDEELSGEFYGAAEGESDSHTPEEWGEYVTLSSKDLSGESYGTDEDESDSQNPEGLSDYVTLLSKESVKFYGAAKGEPGSHNPKGWGNYVSLSCAYEARACLLMEMEQYRKCMKDIDIVLELGCPPLTAAKLRKMKQICKMKSPSETASPIPPEPITESPSKHFGEKPKCSPSKSTSSSPKSFKYRCPDPPVIKDQGEAIPAFSSSVRFSYNEDLGRHLVACEDIAHGELLAVEEGFSTVVKMEHLRTFCVVCMKRTLSPLPCPSCSLVVFCSQSCRIRGLAHEHWIECPIMPILLELNMGINPLLALRLFTRQTYCEMRQMASVLLAEETSRAPKYRGFDEEVVYDHTNYRTVFHLVTNKERRNYKDLLSRAMEAFVILKLLKTSGRYFRDKHGKDFRPSEEELIFTGSMLMHHMMNLPCNSQEIFEVEIVGKEVDKNPIRVYGAGVWPAVSLMSHACYPSCVVLSYGKYRVVKACRAIPAGAQLTCQYVDVVKGCYGERSARLLPQYFFVCQCEACEKNWPDGLQYNTSFNLRCVKCRSPIFYLTKKCTNCKLLYRSRSAVTGNTSLFTYDYTTVRRKVEQALKDYKRAEQRLIKKGSESDDDLKIVSDLIELYDNYVELPSYMHVAAQNTYNSMSHVFASSAHSIEDYSPQCQVS